MNLRMKLFLIRHGESMQNTKENYQIGLPDHKVYLTEKGKEEAKKAGLFLLSYVNTQAIDLNSSAMWVSPYLRTRQTASIINESLNIEKVKEDYALIEQRYGLFSDKEISLLRTLYPESFAFYDNYYQNDGKFYAKLPQGESPMDVAIRTRLFLETIFRDKEENLFIVSHGTVLRTIVMNMMHYAPEWFNQEPNPGNCSIRLVNTLDNTNDYIYNPPKKRIKRYESQE
ncbi:MAG: histidine phosphatase family protein [Bacilli bacterium]|nr:histidine phosphatase family protein [Bacilli bacterium]